MNADIGDGPVKKFRKLTLVHLDVAVAGVKGDIGPALCRVVNDDVLLLASHFLGIVLPSQNLFSDHFSV